MKKVLFLLVCITGIFGCNQSGVVSINTIKKALDIAYTETKDFKFRGMDGVDFAFVKEYLREKKYLNNMECSVLDLSDVEGTKHLRACLLRGVDIDSGRSANKDILVIATQIQANKDIVRLMFFSHVKKTDKGFYYSKMSPVEIAVNLKTKKIGKI